MSRLISSEDSQTFFMFRHAETDWNVIRKLQGHSDIDLNSNGEQQAKQLRLRLEPLSFDKIISSDLIRARKTAELGVLSPDQDQRMILIDSALREVHLGEAEGRKREELIHAYGEPFWNQWSSHQMDSLDLRFKGGESKRDLLNRLIPSLKKHLRHSPSARLAFVSHGLALRTLCHFLHPELTETQFVGNCGALKFIYQHSSNQFRLVKYYPPDEKIL